MTKVREKGPVNFTPEEQAQNRNEKKEPLFKEGQIVIYRLFIVRKGVISEDIEFLR